MDNWPMRFCSMVLLVTVSTDNAQSLKTSIMTVSSRAKENANSLTISKPPLLRRNGLRYGIAFDPGFKLTEICNG